MHSECISLKLIQKVQLAFLRGTNCSSWKSACEKFPKYTTAEQLEPYKKLDFSGKSLPSAFLSFCQRVLSEKESTDDAEVINDDIFSVNHENALAVFWKVDVKTVTPEKLMATLKLAMPSNSISFSGFALSFFDLTNGKIVCMHAKFLLRGIKKLCIFVLLVDSR